MHASIQSSLVPIGTIAGLLALITSFLLGAWERPLMVNDVIVVDSTFGAPVTVRMSAAELMRTDGDVSMLSCYSCHETDSPPEIGYDADGILIWEEHKFDFELRHGRSHRNEFCYTCHAKENLEKLRAPDGTLMNIDEGNLLCGSCHGTLYRDWEDNLHGRVTGYWNRDMGPTKQEDCTSCHNPHNPAFPSLIPSPGPQALRPSDNSVSHTHDEE